MIAAHTAPALLFFFFTDPATTQIYTLSLHDALPISARSASRRRRKRTSDATRRALLAERCDYHGGASRGPAGAGARQDRSEEHTSELQSHHDLVCRLLLEKKNNKNDDPYIRQ